MQFSRYLTYSLLATLAGLPVGALAGGLVLGALGYFGHTGISFGLSQSLGVAFVSAIPAILLGLVPALLWGAPAYALLAAGGHAGWFGAVVVGVAPGIAAMAFAPEWGALLVMFGVPVAISTHLFARNRVRSLRNGPNNSSKRTRVPRAA